MNEDRHILSTAKCRSIILISRNVRFVRIFAGVPYIGALNDSGILESGDAETFPSKFPTLKPTDHNTLGLIHSHSSTFQ